MTSNEQDTPIEPEPPRLYDFSKGPVDFNARVSSIDPATHERPIVFTIEPIADARGFELLLTAEHALFLAERLTAAAIEVMPPPMTDEQMH